MSKKKDELSCQNCAANLKFKPGTTALVCEYCGTKNEISADTEEIEELDYNDAISDALSTEEMQEIIIVKCTACAAEVTLKPNITSDECPFCGTSLVVANKQSAKIIKPKSLLPFKVDKKQAQDEFKKWLGSLWFAPSKVAQFARNDGLQGVYLPFWTFDFDTYSDYSGQRGDNYYVTESYTEYVNGSPVTKTRQVTQTRWSSVSGRVENGFDDVLIVATKSVTKDILEKLEPWDLTSLLAYKDEYLSGFRSESYQVKLEEGLESAKKIIYEDICAAAKDEIGGDIQTVSSVRTEYEDITFKHILLPVWISAYKYQDKVFKFVVNAQTGEVQGERPVSYTKIVALVVSIIIALILLVSIFSKSGHKDKSPNSLAPTSTTSSQYNPNSINTRPNTTIHTRPNSTLNTINNTINAVGAGTTIYNSIKNSKPKLPSSYQKQGKSYKVYNSANQQKSYSKKSSSSSSSSSSRRSSSSSSSSSRKRR